MNHTRSEAKKGMMSSKNELNIAEKIAVWVLWAKCWTIAIMPHFVRYRIYAPFVRFVMRRVIRYRVAVVDSNLKRCLPELSDKEREEIREKFYTYFSEIVISTLSLARTSSWRSIFPKGKNIDDSVAAQTEGTMENMRARMERDDQSAIVFTAHLGLWEYILFFAKFSGITSVGAYHPLENKIMNELFKRLRSHEKSLTIPSNEVIRFAIRNGKRYNGEKYALGLIADQNPPLARDTNWYKFLAEETIFFEGGEKIAAKIELPIYYLYQLRTAPGRYEIRYKIVWDGKEKVEPTQITRRYVKLLEESIRNTPELWLWSHKRFKRTKAVQMYMYDIPEPKTIE